MSSHCLIFVAVVTLLLSYAKGDIFKNWGTMLPILSSSAKGKMSGNRLEATE